MGRTKGNPKKTKTVLLDVKLTDDKMKIHKQATNENSTISEESNNETYLFLPKPKRSTESMKLSKSESKFVAACKSKNPMDELLKTMKETYLCEEEDFPHLADALISICDKYNICTSRQLMIEMNPNKQWLYNCKDDAPYFEKVSHVAYHFIRFAEMSKFEGDDK